MPKYSFDNEYDILIWTFSYLLHRFEDSKNVFAAQCIWWIAGLVELTDVLVYFHRYNIFPSEYHNQLKESSTNNKRDSPTTGQNRDISPLDLASIEVLPVSNTESVASNSGPEESSQSDSDYVDTRVQRVVSETNQYLAESRRLRHLHRLQQRSNPIQTSKQLAATSASKGGQKPKDRRSLINSLDKSKDYSNVELESIFGVLTKWQRQDLRRQIKRATSVTRGLQESIN